MATLSQPIIKPRSPDSAVWGFIKRELSPTPDRLSATVRATLCAVILTLVGETGRSPDIFLSLYIVISLPRDYPKQTLQAALSIAAVVIVSGIVALLLQAAAADSSWARVTVIFAAIFFGMLLGRKLNQGLVGVVFSVMIAQNMLAYDNTSNTEAVVEATLWYALMYLFGLAVATIVEYVFPHPTPLQRLTEGMEQQLQAASAVFKNISGAYLTDEEQKQAGRMDRLAATGIGPLRQMLASASSAGLLPPQDVARFNSLLPFFELLAALAARLGPYEAGDFDPSERQLASRLRERASLLAERVKEPYGTPEEWKPENLAQEARSEAMQARILAEAGEVLDALWNAWYLESEFGARTYQVKTHPPQKSSLSPQPFFARDNVHFAFKAALASIICYVLYNAVGWPGISSAMSTCFIVALDTAGASYRRLALRLAGVVIGGLLFGIGGIALVLSQMDNIVQLLLYVALVFFVSGWVAKGSQRISYAGTNMALAFALVAMSSPTIPYQITEARDRIMGMLLVAIVLWFVFGHLWPVNAIAAQKAKLADLIRDLADLFQLSADEGPMEERITRFHELRQSANQAILAAYDRAEASSYDSPRDPEMQRSLHDGLSTAEALLLLEVVALNLSLKRATDNPVSNAGRKQMTDDYASRLRKLAEEVKTGNREQLDSAVRQLAELLSEWDQSLIHENVPEQARIVQRRHAHIAELLGSVQQF